jgi:uncharacterized protein YjbI with pentapeptide repeats
MASPSKVDWKSATTRPALWVVGALAVIALCWLVWSVPEQQSYRVAFNGSDWAAKQAALANEYRRTLLRAIGGAAVLAGAVLGGYLTWRQLRLSREGQITDRFTNAIGQLGNEKLTVRLGGIYALERITFDSDRDHWTVVEVLSAFVRENAPRTAEAQSPLSPRTDVQAALTVLGRRASRPEPSLLSLARTDLTGADLVEARLARAALAEAVLKSARATRADLSGCNLSEADLTAAHLWEADLQGANLKGALAHGTLFAWANLERASLEHADLTGARLNGARLQGANLNDANLTNADLTEADLRGVDLSGARLDGATFTDAKLEGAIGAPAADSGLK